jgi:GNAT superfamily N-acetyltransferase
MEGDVIDEVSWRSGQYSISTDRSRLQIDVIVGFLAGSYWARGIPREVVERSIANSLGFGLYHGGTQIGFARVVTDRATFAWIGDVFVVEAERGRGLAKQLIAAILREPELQGLRRWMLATRDAHGLYRGFGFRHLEDPARFLERVDRDAYRRAGG